MRRSSVKEVGLLGGGFPARASTGTGMLFGKLVPVLLKKVGWSKSRFRFQNCASILTGVIGASTSAALSAARLRQRIGPR